MSAELVMCSCCGKFVPATNIELSFRRPDEIAAMDKDEAKKRSRFNDDVGVLDEKRYFVRCVLPLPVHESQYPYSIGAWAEVTENDFDVIWEHWTDENQSHLPTMRAVLANQVPLTKGSLACDINITMTGPTTRPKIEILDETCSLFAEQNYGITIHRASEYSDLVRPR